jgi:NAD(P)H-hydrate epimerase
MRPVFTAAEMRALDARAIAELGIPGPELMERAGGGAARLIGEDAGPLRGRRVAVVCGRGNNGGDGFVVARRLAARGVRAEVFLLGRRGDVRGDAGAALARWRGRVREVADEPGVTALAGALDGADLVVDALLGTGLTGPAHGLTARAIGAINAAGRPVVSLDLPSGLPSDTGEVPGPTVSAQRTYTFGGLKRCLLLHPGAAHAGQVRVIDLGIPPAEAARGVGAFLLEESDVAPGFPVRPRDAHKGRFGHLLVIAGSRGKTGAAALAARAALRAGVGLCTVATPASQQPVVAGLGLEYMTEPAAETAAGSLALGARERLGELIAPRDAVALGPGLGLDPDTRALACALVADAPRPMVLDADALSAVAGDLAALSRAGGPRLLTPHPGEMARLAGLTVAAVQADRIEVARRFAADHGVFLALKGAGTVIAGPSGPAFINPTGNPGMASGGSGDVLTGIVGALLARGMEPLAALQAACFLHGRAGDLAAAALGEDGLIASDLIERIPAAIGSLRRAPTAPPRRR